MVFTVGNRVKWDDQCEPCESGICLGIVIEAEKTGQKMVYHVKWTNLCTLHREIDPTGTGPYTSGLTIQ